MSSSAVGTQAAATLGGGACHRTASAHPLTPSSRDARCQQRDATGKVGGSTAADQTGGGGGGASDGGGGGGTAVDNSSGAGGTAGNGGNGGAGLIIIGGF